MEIPIIHKSYKFYLFWHSVYQTLPKIERYSLGVKTENLILEILILLNDANAIKDYRRLIFLGKVDYKLKTVQILIRACFDVKAINQNKYLKMQESLLEIGRMLGGWIKSEETKNSA